MVDLGAPPPTMDEDGPLDYDDGLDSMFMTDRQIKVAAQRAPTTQPSAPSQRGSTTAQPPSAPRPSASRSLPRPNPPSAGSSSHHKLSRSSTTIAQPPPPQTTARHDDLPAAGAYVSAAGGDGSKSGGGGGGARPAAFDWGGFDQVATLQAANQNLLTEIDALKIELATAAHAHPAGSDIEVDGLIPAGATASGRIASLSKRNRDLTAAVNAERARAKTAAKEAGEMRKAIRNLEAKLDRTAASEARAQTKLALATGGGGRAASAARVSTSSNLSRSSPEDRASVGGGAQSDGSGDTNKIREYRRECQDLRRELQRTTAALTKEVGTDVVVARLLAGESGWQGRAEQISRLKVELTKLKANAGGGGSKRSKPPQTSAEERSTQSIRILEQQRHQALEASAEERDAAVDQAVELKQKVDGLKARNRALGRELKTSKERVSVMETELEEEQKKVHELVQVSRDAGVFRQPAAPTQPSPQEKLNGPEVRRLHDKMHAQEATIVHLEHRLKSALQLARQGRPLSGSPLPARVITPNGAGIGGEGPGASATRSDPETLRRIVELDSLVTAGTLERAQLRQACTDREIRCDELEESVAALQLELRHARASTVTLRSELARVQQQMGAPPTAMQPSQRNRQELEEKLGLQLDENEALRTTLKDTVRAKTEEITLLHDLLESTKRVFSDGLRSYKHRLIQSTPR